MGWSDAAGRPTYCLEGSLFNAGTVIQWLRDGLGLIERSDQINQLAAGCASSGGVMLVPAFTGWGTPHWDPGGPGAADRSDPRQRSSPDRSRRPGGHRPGRRHPGGAGGGRPWANPWRELAADGGAAAADLLLQAQADATGLPVRRRADLESTSRGVALLAGVEAGVVPALQAWGT